MSAPARADLDLLMLRLGRDLGLVYGGSTGWWEEADLDVARRPGLRDVAVASDLTAADQLLVNRLKTRRGELAALGHPNYGSRHHDLIGEPNTERTRNLIKRHVLECLADEPRIARILSCTVSPDPARRDGVRIVLSVRLIDHDDARNLVVPFSLETAA
jgi:phage baseplate assembly protein W